MTALTRCARLNALAIFFERVPLPLAAPPSMAITTRGAVHGDISS